ncbi:MAG: tellurite resistance TerB family protein, partial [Myxococcota bacterium]
TIDGLLPLGPEFMTTISTTIGGMASSTLGNNAIFSKLSSNVPGSSVEEKQSFIVNALNTASGYLTGFVTSRGLTQDGISSKLGGVVDVANSGMDYLAAGLDASTNYFAHTGTQTVARRVIEDAWKQVQAEPAPTERDDAQANTAPSGRRRRSLAERDLGEGVDLLLMDTMALAAIIDGHISDEEEQELFNLASSLPSLKGMTDFDIEDALHQAIERVSDAGVDATLERLADGLTEREDREEAFMLAASVMLIDEEVEPEEDDFIYTLGEALGFRQRSIEGMLDQVTVYVSDGAYDVYEEWYEDE